MQSPDELQDKVVEGQRHEAHGRFDRAETCYLAVLNGLDPKDKFRRGTIFNNLGANATNALDPESAIQYFRQAIELLEGEKGEGILQTAHAFWNIARIQILQNDPAAVEASDQAFMLYSRYSLTSSLDLADAHICRILAFGVADRAISAEEFDEALSTALDTSYEELNPRLAREYLSLLLSLAATTPEASDSMRSELRKWAGPSEVDEIWEAIAQAMGNVES